jgi:hypothetical protein
LQLNIGLYCNQVCRQLLPVMLQLTSLLVGDLQPPLSWIAVQLLSMMPEALSEGSLMLLLLTVLGQPVACTGVHPLPCGELSEAH